MDRQGLAMKEPKKNALLQFLVECLQFGTVFCTALLAGSVVMLCLWFVIEWVRSLSP
jgi:hypothetical protein